MAIRAVTFDVGGVLWPPPEPVINREWETRLGLPEGSLYTALFDNPASRQALIGQASSEEAWAEAARRLSMTRDELEEMMNERRTSRSWDEELLAYIRTLRPEYKTGVISNSFPGARQGIIKYVNSDTFDVIVFSDEEGVRKPDPEIYRRALSRLGVKAEETIFVDDLVENVTSAQALGMRAILCTGSLQVRDEIDRLIRPVIEV